MAIAATPETSKVNVDADCVRCLIKFYLRPAMPMCSRCDVYDKFIKQADDRGMQELVAFLEHEKAAYVEAAVEANGRD